MPITVTADNFRETVDQPAIVMLDFWAAWCGPCRAFAPVFEKAAADHPDVVFGKVDTDAEQELAAAFRISAIPTLMIFRDGVLLYAEPGVVPAQGLVDLIEQVRAVDMNEVRARIEAAAAAEAAGAEREAGPGGDGGAGGPSDEG